MATTAKKKVSENINLSISLDPPTVAALDALVIRLKGKAAGVQVTRTDAIRHVMAKGLERVLDERKR